MKRVYLILVAAIWAYAGGMPCYLIDGFYKKFPEYVKIDHRIEGEPTDADRKRMDKEFAEYSGPRWCQGCLGGCHKERVVPAGVGSPVVHVGCGYGDKAKRYRFKIVVRQKNPCFIVKKYHPRATISKVDERTVEIVAKNDSWCDIGLENYGRGWLDHKYNKRKKSDYKVILGKDFSCVDRDNEETWEIYYRSWDKWKMLSKEKFIYRADHRVLQRR